jgi:hypothetical protein
MLTVIAIKIFELKILKIIKEEVGAAQFLVPLQCTGCR